MVGAYAFLCLLARLYQTAMAQVSAQSQVTITGSYDQLDRGLIKGVLAQLGAIELAVDVLLHRLIVQCQ